MLAFLIVASLKTIKILKIKTNKKVYYFSYGVKQF